MNPLQISLIVVAVVVVVAIVLYNWLQERKYRSQSQDLFQPQEDVLLRSDAADLRAVHVPPQRSGSEPAQPGRIDPQIAADTPVAASLPRTPADAEPATATIPDLHALREHDIPVVMPEPVMPAPFAAQPVDLPATPADTLVDFEVRIHALDAIPGSAMNSVMEHLRHAGKPLHWWGYNVNSAAWETIAGWREDAYTEVALVLQLADRNGAVSEEQLVQLCTQARQLASRYNGVAECPDMATALRRAGELDLFCVDVDVLIGLNVVSRGNDLFAGARIAELAQTAGLQLGKDGVYQKRNDQNEVMYSLCNHESTAFSDDTAAQLMTHGVTLLFDLPRVANGLVAFDQMTALAHELTEKLGGQLVDDNIRPLTQAGIDKIRAQLAHIYQRMQENGIPGGGERALRLFN
jgi:FtsZ-interacting cell division protein ZipA